MLRAPIWMTSATSSTGLEVARVHALGDDRQAGLLLGLGEQPQALLAEPLERVGRGARLVGAAAEQRAAGRLDDARGAERLVARLDRARPGDHREVLAADPAAVDLDHVGCCGRICADASLYGLRIGTTCSTPGAPSRPSRIDVLAVADRADHGHLLAARRMGSCTDVLDAVDDGLDLLLRRRRFHHDHHLDSSKLRLWTLYGRRALGRPVGDRFVHDRAPREIARRNGSRSRRRNTRRR